MSAYLRTRSAVYNARPLYKWTRIHPRSIPMRRSRSLFLLKIFPRWEPPFVDNPIADLHVRRHSPEKFCRPTKKVRYKVINNRRIRQPGCTSEIDGIGMAHPLLLDYEPLTADSTAARQKTPLSCLFRLEKQAGCCSNDEHTKKIRAHAFLRFATDFVSAHLRAIMA